MPQDGCEPTLPPPGGRVSGQDSVASPGSGHHQRSRPEQATEGSWPGGPEPLGVRKEGVSRRRVWRHRSQAGKGELGGPHARSHQRGHSPRLLLSLPGLRLPFLTSHLLPS